MPVVTATRHDGGARACPPVLRCCEWCELATLALAALHVWRGEHYLMLLNTKQTSGGTGLLLVGKAGNNTLQTNCTGTK